MTRKPQLTEIELQARLKELESLESSTKASLAMAHDGFKKCRKRGGAAAYKRSWHFEEQIKKLEAQLAEISQEQRALTKEMERRMAT